MKRLLFTFLLLISASLPVIADDVTEDFLDIAANYCIQGNYTEAVNYLDKAIAHEPDNQDLREIKNGLLRIQNQSAKSYLTSHNPQVATADSYRKKGDKQQEKSSLIAGANAGNPWAMYYLAEYYHANKQFNTALDYYDKVLDTKAGFAQCYLGITLTLLEMQNYDAALNALNYYMEKCPQEDLGYALRAEIHLNLKEYVNAEADIITALSINENTDYKLLEAKILYARGNYKSAKDKLLTLTDSVKTAEIYKYLGLCDYALKDYSSALLNLNNAIILSEDDKEALAKYNEVKSKLINGSTDEQKI